jgi:hypothetical protein
MRHGPHIAPVAPFRGSRPATRTFSRTHFITSSHISRNHARSFSNSRFRQFRFYPYGYAFYPWWGWDWDSGYFNGCDSYDGTCDVGPSDEQWVAQQGGSGYSVSAGSVSDTSSPRPMITVYLRDGSGYGALDYWLSNGVLHIETTYGEHKVFPVEQVDLVRTGKENALHGVSFTLANAPMMSDPGPVLAPDSYAPVCPVGANTAFRAGPSSTLASNTDSAFGATGRTSATGFTVTSVRADSPAAAAGLQSGDVIVRVDCQPVRNAQDLESAFSSSKGPSWVSYLIQGSWLTDKKISR